ncbi:MAG: DUF4199 domain-containing protein [Bacteroidetes bacterium]|nr:MAG: DUF4199 domain-containing protein [Bacteroidota bacterium]
MSPTLKSGLLIGVLCGIWTHVMGFTGWYKDPAMLNAFYLVILIQLVVLVWGLKQTASEKAYGGQVMTGTLMSLYGGVILFFNSLLFTMVLFPHYFEDLRMMYAEMMRGEGKSETEIETAIQAAMVMQTPFLQALFGLIGTVVTGLIVSLVVAIFYRKK